MTNRQKREEISARFRQARATVEPIAGLNRFHIPEHKTTTLCSGCYVEVYQLPGLTLNPDGSRHSCEPAKRDTDRPPRMT
jgi:hypothetical protein